MFICICVAVSWCKDYFMCFFCKKIYITDKMHSNCVVLVSLHSAEADNSVCGAS